MQRKHTHRHTLTHTHTCTHTLTHTHSCEKNIDQPELKIQKTCAHTRSAHHTPAIYTLSLHDALPISHTLTHTHTCTHTLTHTHSCEKNIDQPELKIQKTCAHT